ncbi:MAG: hypothetical protein Q4C77_10345 [Eubacteriales bacterium]|nr:hypothetical protein [Eubacteriales bacterium]
MTIKEIAYKVEDLRIEAEKINSLQNALFTAIYSESNAISTYEWAFVVLDDMTHSLKDELKIVTNELFAIFRGEKGGCENGEVH